MDWNKIAEYLRESGYFPPETNCTICDSIYVESLDFCCSIFPHGNQIEIYLRATINNKKFYVGSSYDEPEDTYNFIHFLREELDDMYERLDRKIAKEFPNIF